MKIQVNPQPARLAAALRKFGDQLQGISDAMANEGQTLLESGEVGGEAMIDIAHEIGVFGRGCVFDAIKAEGGELPPTNWVDPGNPFGGIRCVTGGKR